MAWSWSHSNEAYAAVERQVMRRAEKADRDGDRESMEWLITVYAEWQMGELRLPFDQWSKLYKRAQRKGYRLAQGPMASLRSDLRLGKNPSRQHQP